MPSFVRKNVVTFSTVFTAADGTATQPAAANVVVSYVDEGGSGHQDTLEMTYNAPIGNWTATWDTSASGDGSVSWMVYGYGTLQGATQG